ncbi:MAG: SH3 domain-containing protein [Bacteroidales bacterium]|nr:SH3 domain-containing protein [Bacteroidales bacterium]
MKHKNIRTFIIFFLFGTFISILLSGCFELIGLEGIEAVEGIEGLSAEEAVALGSEADILAEEGLTLSEATGEVIVSDETTFYSELSRVKVEPGGTRLSIMKNGKLLDIGEIESENSIRLRNINRPLELPGKIYRTSANVNVRTGGDLNYKVFKTISKDQLVLVLDEQNGWCKVEIGKGKVGWMYAAYLIAASNHHNDYKVNQDETSNIFASIWNQSDSIDETNQTKNNTDAKSDSVRLFSRYKNTNQQYASLSSNSPIINQAYFNNSWHTYFYYQTPVSVIQRPTVHRQNTQSQNHPTSNTYRTGNPRQQYNRPLNNPRNNSTSQPNSRQQYYRQGDRGERTNSPNYRQDDRRGRTNSPNYRQGDRGGRTNSPNYRQGDRGGRTNSPSHNTRATRR